MAGQIEVPDYNEIANEDDPFKLAALVESGGPMDTDPGAEKPNVESARGHQFDDTGSKNDAGTKEPTDTGAGKGGDDDAAAAADTGAGKEADAGKEGGEAADKDKSGARIKAADGEGEIPYAVLKNTREQNAQLRAELEEARAQLEAAKKGDTGAGDDPTEMTPEQRQEHIQQLQAEIQSVEDDYDPDLAKPMRRLLEENLRLAKRIDQMDESLKNQPTEEDQREGQAIMDAIDKSPVMAEWYSRTDDSWYQRATQVHQAAIQNDEAYQAMSHDERMRELPNRVQAVFGKDPELQATPPSSKADEEKPAKPDTKQETKQGEEEAIPRSMDDLPPGGTPDSSGKFGPIGEMSGDKMTDYFGRLADKGQLDQVLANFSG